MLQVILLIYAVLSIAFMAYFIATGNAKGYSVWLKMLMILFSPFVILGAILYIIAEQIINLSWNKGFKPIVKMTSRPHRLNSEDFDIWSKDTIRVRDKKMSIDQYNAKFNKSLTLDDVYGKGYIARLTAEEVFECESNIVGRYGVQPALPESDYKKAAIAMATDIVSGHISKIIPLCSDDCLLLIYEKDLYFSMASIVDYWNNWLKKVAEQKVSISVTVKWCLYYFRPAVYVDLKGYRNMIILFRLNDESGLIDEITFAPNPLQKYHVFSNINFDVANYSKKYMLTKITDSDVEQKDDRLSCPKCGENSSFLEWHIYNINSGARGIVGEVSMCPHCNCVVEMFPTTSVRLDGTYNSSCNKEFLSRITSKIASEKWNPFVPTLQGCMVYYLDETDDKILLNMGKNQAIFEEEVKQNRSAEALNKLAISISENGDSEQAKHIFMQAIEKGSKNAMINLFTTYWSNEEKYSEAVGFLLQIAKAEHPSIACLYNLAVLYFYGDAFANNTLEADAEKAKQILYRIINSPKSDEEIAAKVVENAHKFLNVMDTLNVYSILGQQIQKRIIESIVKTDGIQDKGELFYVAKSLRPLSDRHIGLHIASCDTEDIGDKSWFYFYSDSNKEERDKNICRNLTVDNTAMGAWQLYLVMTAQTIMPVFWHGGYISRTFIFDVKDLSEIQPIQNYDFSILEADGILMPMVELSNDRSKADVYCCYWNDWKGLVREHMQVIFNADGTASCSIIEEFVLYPYDCGICL
jgi:hypothetical protein